MKKIEGNLYELTDEEVAKLGGNASAGRWKPVMDEEYWYVDPWGVVNRIDWSDDSGDQFCYAQRNVFRTKEEAKAHLNYLNAVAELRDSSEYKPVWDDGTENWSVYIRRPDNELYLDFSTSFDRGQLVWYPTEEAAKQSVEDHREAWLTYFGVKS